LVFCPGVLNEPFLPKKQLKKTSFFYKKVLTRVG